jgi:hypothetical protein
VCDSQAKTIKTGFLARFMPFNDIARQAHLLAGRQLAVRV